MFTISMNEFMSPVVDKAKDALLRYKSPCFTNAGIEELAESLLTEAESRGSTVRKALAAAKFWQDKEVTRMRQK